MLTSGWLCVCAGIDFTAPQIETLRAQTGPLRPGQRPVEVLAGAPLVHTSRGPVLDLSALSAREREAFSVWLSADASTFWVNLNPNEPDRVIEAQLGRTAVGRTLLEADLLMKMAVARLLHPDLALGSSFWSELYSHVNPSARKLCLSFRTWLVPQHAAVVETPDRAALVNGSLRAMLESDYFGVQAADGGNEDVAAAVFAGCDADARRDGAIASRLFRQLLLPELEALVNTDKAFERLRAQLFMRLLAEWLRAKNVDWRAAYAELRATDAEADRPRHLDVAFAEPSGELHAQLASEGMAPAETFAAYARSYSSGEFNVTRYVQVGELAYAKVFFYGAIDFTMPAFTAQGYTASIWAPT